MRDPWTKTPAEKNTFGDQKGRQTVDPAEMPHFRCLHSLRIGRLPLFGVSKVRQGMPGGMVREGQTWNVESFCALVTKEVQEQATSPTYLTVFSSCPRYPRV